MTRSESREPSKKPGEAPRPEPILVDNLMAGTREIILIHDGEPYRLRITSNNKLILTK